MTQDFVREILDSQNVIYFPFCDWLFPNGLKINNVIFTIPWFNGTSIEIYWYGFLIALGMLLAVIYVTKRCRSFGLDSDRVMDVVLCGLVGGILGARAYYVIFSLPHYLTDEGGLDIGAVLRIRDGGLAIYGGVIGALVFGAIMAKIRKVRLLPMLDLAGLGLLIGQCIGRWGNFFNQEAFGCATTLPWGMTSNTILNELYFFYNPDNTSIITHRATSMVAHPCFLYESLWCLAGFIFLHFYSRKFRKFDGEIFLIYIGWYGAGRFWIEALRTDSLYIPGTPFKVSQLVAGTCVLFSIVLLAIKYSMVKKTGVILYKDSDESKELLRIKDEKNKKVDKNAELSEHILVEPELERGITSDFKSSSDSIDSISENVTDTPLSPSKEAEGETSSESVPNNGEGEKEDGNADN